jgi:membrane glycosyltransferase
MLMEMLFSMLLAPVRMIFHTRFVLAAFLGWAATWNSPQRDDDSTPWSEAVRATARRPCWALPGPRWWLAEPELPVVAGADRRFADAVDPGVGDFQPHGLGLAAKDEKLFLIPEEYATPQELLATDQYTHENRWHALHDGFVRAVVDPRRTPWPAPWPLPVTVRPSRSKAACRARGQGDGSRPERPGQQYPPGLLSDPVALARLHEQVWAEHNAAWIDVWRASVNNDPHSPLLPLHPENQANRHWRKPGRLKSQARSHANG